MPVNTLTANNLTDTQPRQDARPFMLYLYRVTSITSGAAGLGQPTISQVLIATNLASGAAGFANNKPTISQALSAVNLASGAASFDKPNVICGVASSLTTGAAGFGNNQPAIGQVLSPINLAAGSAGFGNNRPSLNQLLISTNLTTGAAGLGGSLLGFPVTNLASSAAGLVQPGISFPNIPIIRSISTVPYGNRTNLTLTPPAGLANNDILLAFIVNTQLGSAANTLISPPAGFGQIGYDVVDNINSTTFLRSVVYWKLANNESGNYTFTTASGNSEGILIAISGAAGSAVDVSIFNAGSQDSTATSSGSTTSLNATASSVTTGFPDDLSFFFASALSGYPNAIAPVGINAILNDLQNGVIFAGWQPEPNTSTVTGSFTMQVNSTVNLWTACLVCIRSTITLNVLSPSSLTAGGAGLGQPAIALTSHFTSLSLATGAAGLGQPAILTAPPLVASTLLTARPTTNQSILSQPNTLIATNLMPAAAGLGTPSFGLENLVSGPFYNLSPTSPTPVFGLITVLTAQSIASGAAYLGTPVYTRNNSILVASSLASQASTTAVAVLTQTKNTLTAVSLASQSAGINAAVFNTLNVAFVSVANYGSTSPTVDTGFPTITLTAAFNFPSPNPLSVGAAGFDHPALGQLQNLVATSLTSGAAGLGLPQFVQFQSLTATPITAGAAGIGLASLSVLTIYLTPQANFVSVDTNIYQLNAVLSGVIPTTTLSISPNAWMLGYTSPSVTSNLTSIAVLSIINKAALAVASTWTIREYQLLRNGSAMAPSPSLKASAATFIFDTELLTSTTSLAAGWTQNFITKSNLLLSASLTIKENASQIILSGLVSSTSLFANPVKPTATQWAGSALWSPASTLTAVVSRNVPILASLSPSLSFGGSIQAYGLSAMSPVSTLGALAVAQIAVFPKLSPTALMVVSESMQAIASGLLTVVSTATINSFLLKPLNIGLAPQTTMLSPALLREYAATNLSVSLTSRVVESQRQVSSVYLTPMPVLNIQPQAMLSPSILWNVQSALVVNERILPEGTAFYFVNSGMVVTASQLMMSKVAMTVQPQMISHEGLLMLQAPLITFNSATMATAEHIVIGPNLQLISNIVLNVGTLTDLLATQSSLVDTTNFSIQYVLNQSAAATFNNISTMPSSFSMAMAAVTGLSSGCYFDIKTKLHHHKEISALITAQKSRIRIVAKGNLVNTDIE